MMRPDQWRLEGRCSQEKNRLRSFSSSRFLYERPSHHPEHHWNMTEPVISTICVAFIEENTARCSKANLMRREVRGIFSFSSPPRELKTSALLQWHYHHHRQRFMVDKAPIATFVGDVRARKIREATDGRTDPAMT